MAIRYYLAPVIGTGARSDPQRSVIRDWALARKGRRCKAWIEVSKLDGLIRRSWSFCEVSAQDGDFSALDADTRVALLAAEGARLNASPDAATDAALAKFGITRDLSDTTIRTVLRRIGRTFQAGYVVSR